MRQIGYLAGIIIFLTFAGIKPIIAQQCPNGISYSFVNGNACSPAITQFFVCAPNAAQATWTFTGPGTVTNVTNGLTVVNTLDGGGTYTAKAVVTFSNGTTQTYTVNVVVKPKPNACMTVSALTGCAPLTVCFDARCTNGGTPPYIAGIIPQDGEPPFSLVNLQGCHTYTITNCVRPVLTIIDQNGCRDDYELPTPGICPSVKPVACIEATGPTSFCNAPANICFNNCSTPATGLTYAWTFTGGTPSGSTSSTPCVNYTNIGGYDVSLTVKNAVGCTSTVAKPKYINIGNNGISFTLSGKDSICDGSGITAAAKSGNLSYAWTSNPGGVVFSATDPLDSITNITFPGPGDYSITLTATLPGGCTATQTKVIHVFAIPTVSFDATPLTQKSCKPPLSVTINNISAGPNLNFDWNFSGGVPSVNPPPSSGSFNVKFNSCGSYGVSLTVTNKAGCAKTYRIDDLVQIVCPVGDFQVDTLKPPLCAPLTFRLKAIPPLGDTLKNYQYCWNFDGKTIFNTCSTADSLVTHTFDTVGCYRVALKMQTLTGGCADTIIKQDIVCAGKHFTDSLDFTVTPDTTCAPNPVAFAVTLQVPKNNCQTTYEFFFGDGGHTKVNAPDNPAIKASAIHQYTDTGCFDVKLIRCNCFCCDTIIKEAVVCVMPPIVQMAISRACTSPDCITFDTKGSKGVERFEWVFTPAGVGTVTFDNAGKTSGTICYPQYNTSYGISVTGHNDKFHCSQKVDVTAQTIKPIPDFIFSQNPICVSDSVFITNKSVGVAKYKWSLRDKQNNTILTSDQFCFTNPKCPSGYKFPAPGDYCLSVIGTDVGGCSAETTKCITVNGLVPEFNGAPTSGCSPLTVNFQDITANNPPYGNYVNPSTWNFGDTASSSNTATGRNVNHTYIPNQGYSVTLCVKDDKGCTTCKTENLYIKVSKPDVGFHFTDLTVCKGNDLCVKVDSAVFSTENTYKWILINPAGVVENTLSGTDSACFNLLQSGDYQVRLIATNRDGCKDSIVKSLKAGLIIADFKADTTSTTCPPLLVKFTNLSSGDTLGGLIYHWNFDSDSNSSNFANPFFQYRKGGRCNTVTLTVTNMNGCVSTATKVDYICLGGPTADILVTPDSGCFPLDVNFKAVNSNSISYKWFFGTADTASNFDEVNYTYQHYGIYSPTVVLCDVARQCCYQYPIDIVSVDSIDAKISKSSLDLCSQGMITFSDSTTYSFLDSAVNFITSSWNFGDPGSGPNNISALRNPSHFYSQPGTYPITLTVKSKSGCTDVATTSLLVKPSPSAAAILSKPKLCPGEEICFTYNSTSISPIISLDWNFGDTISGALNTSTQQNPCHIYANAGNYIAVLHVKAQNLCEDTTQFRIHVGGIPPGGAGPDTAVCFLDSIVMHATGGVDYVWSPPTGLSNPNIATPKASPTLQVTYTVLVTDENGCTAIDDVVVGIKPIPTPEISYVDTVCSGQPVTITAGGGIRYLWSTGETTVVINPKPIVQTTYTVTVFNQFQCGADTFADIKTWPLPVVQTSSDTVVCKGDTIKLHANGGISYLWTSNSIILGRPDTSDIRGVIIDTAAYVVTVTDEKGCFTIATVFVTMLPLPPVNAGPDKIVCSGNAVQLHGSGSLTYQWSPTTLFMSPTNIADPIAAPQAPTVNICPVLTGTDINGCVNRDTTCLKILYPFTVNYIPDTCICLNDCAVLYARPTPFPGADTPSHYDWSPPVAIDDVESPTPRACPILDTSYQVIVSDGNCYADTGQVKICINPLPIIVAGDDTVIIAGGLAVLHAAATHTGNFSWQADTTFICNNCQVLDAHPEYITTYVVTITDDNGCRDKDTTIVNVFCNNASVYIPNAFSPNKDEKNDSYFIQGVGFTLKDFRIYDRWGKLVFQTHNINDKWDGKYNGKEFEPNVFVYYFEGVCSTGEVISKKGNITLIR